MAAIGSTVLLLGCGKKEKERDVFNVTAPKIVRSDETLDFKAWDSGNEKTLDLQDALDVSAGSPSRTEVISRCVMGRENVLETFTLPGGGVIKIFKIIPREMIARRLSGDSTCAFEISVYNGAGSRHVFMFSSSVITDSRTNQVEMQIGLDKFRETTDNVTLNYQNFAGVWIRYQNSRPAEAQLLCKDVNFERLRFDQDADLARFDLTATKPLGERESGVLASRPLQTCRAAIFENGLMVGVGPLFQLSMFQSDFHIALTDTHYRNLGDPSNYNQLVDAANQGQARQYSSFTLTNPSEGARRIRIPKGPLQTAHTFYYQVVDPLVRTTIVNQTATLEVFSDGKSIIDDNGGAWVVTLPPGGAINLNVWVWPLRQPNCTITTPVFESIGAGGIFKGLGKIEVGERVIGLEAAKVNVGFREEVTQPLVVDEILEDGSIFSQFQVNLGQPLVVSQYGRPPEDAAAFQTYADTGGGFFKGCAQP